MLTWIDYIFDLSFTNCSNKISVAPVSSYYKIKLFRCILRVFCRHSHQWKACVIVKPPAIIYPEVRDRRRVDDAVMVFCWPQHQNGQNYKKGDIFNSSLLFELWTAVWKFQILWKCVKVLLRNVFTFSEHVENGIFDDVTKYVITTQWCANIGDNVFVKF